MDATPAITPQEAQRMLGALALAELFAFSVRELGPGSCTMEAPFLDLFLRPGELVSGPVYMALADAAVWVALMTIVGPMPMAVTSELTSNFLRGAVREDVLCAARILSLEGGIAHASAQCTTRAGVVLTHHSATYSLPPRSNGLSRAGER
ncbi:MAG: PaaI family thioesterase [bacterium]|nr:PaaI family thioesterase [bacterium]